MIRGPEALNPEQFSVYLDPLKAQTVYPKESLSTVYIINRSTSWRPPIQSSLARKRSQLRHKKALNKSRFSGPFIWMPYYIYIGDLKKGP